MILVKPSVEPFSVTTNMEKIVEMAGRTAYQSDPQGMGSAIMFIRKIIKLGHESVLEHASASFKIICDRGISHELVRHRLASYTQESTRFCSYGGGVKFVIPPWVDMKPGDYSPDIVEYVAGNDMNQWWFEHMLRCEKTYKCMLNGGWAPQKARSILPNSLKTEIAMTANMREWRHFLRLRMSLKAHPQMQEIANMIYDYLLMSYPVFVEDLEDYRTAGGLSGE